ncbi:hypothetical protein N0V92_008972 [Colletotrichum tropicale]|nr:hypothetical protein N0V92_008972 [Colletotrichum tropicale]
MAPYGLVGVEVAMLETNFFRPPHLVALLSHSESTWSGPGGWLRCFKRSLVRGDDGNGRPGLGNALKSLLRSALAPKGWLDGAQRLAASVNTYRLWYLLSFLSLCLYVGLPLSGLAMELFDGYVQVGNSVPMVVGRNSSNFHGRYFIIAPDSIKNAWKKGAPTILPGIGVLYTPETLDRTKQESVRKVPNTLPLDDGVEEMFLVPQAKEVVSGSAWGMRARYNCSVVDDVAKFTILGNGSAIDCSEPIGVPCTEAYISTGFEYTLSNVWAYFEVGVSMPFNNNTIGHPTFEDQDHSSFNSPDEAQEDALEFAFWQARRPAQYGEPDSFVNETLPSVRAMPSPFKRASNQSWVVDEDFLQRTYLANLRTNLSEIMQGNNMIYAADPIGVRCRSRSMLGTAKLNAASMTFEDFAVSDPTPWNKTDSMAEEPVRRLGYYAQSTVRNAAVDAIFMSTNARSGESRENTIRYNRFVSPDELKRSLLLAYGLESLELMYDGKYGFEGSWEEPSMEAAAEGKVLWGGELTPWISVVTIGLWAFGSLVLSVVYGFRKRSSDSLNGFSFFRFGVYSADSLRDCSRLHQAKEPDELEELERMWGTLQAMQRIPQEMKSDPQVTVRWES